MDSLIKSIFEFSFKIKKETIVRVYRKSETSYISFIGLQLDRQPRKECPFDLSKSDINLNIVDDNLIKKEKNKKKIAGYLVLYQEEEDDNVDINLAYKTDKLNHLITSIETNEKNYENLTILISIDEKEIKKKRDSYETYMIEQFHFVNSIKN